jgi:hypothetical protein
MTQPILTDDQRLFLHDLTVKKDLLPDWTFTKIAAVRTELLDLGLLTDDFGWVVVADEGLRALDTPHARRILRARANA